MLQQRPNTFAQTILSLSFSLATRRRTIHSGLPVILAQSAVTKLIAPVVAAGASLA
jgi:hypothetical protein